MPVTVHIRASDLSSSDAATPMSLSFDSPRIVIGRSDGCDVRLPDPSVSPRHASLRQRGTTYSVVDEGSTNGTWVGGTRLNAHAQRQVADGEFVRVGRVWLEIRFDVTAQPSSPGASRELALAIVARKLAANGEGGGPRLLAVAGPDVGKSLMVAAPGVVLTMGRGTGADLLLDEPDASRRHVQISRRGDVLLIRDLGSKNGTFLNDLPLDPDVDAQARIGDILRIGEDVFVYENAAAEALSEVERCADEPLAPEDRSEPPTGPTSGTQRPASSSSIPLSSQGPVSQGQVANSRPESSRAPLLPQTPPAPPTRSGWGASDYVVLVIAVGVLVLSAVGLWLLFRG
jgi:pSer/pThr/pTyr-binding forkhead associated (FHA) protein